MPKLRDGSSLSAARCQAAGRKVIRPFVCSTFQDFHAERDFLQDRIFPQLNTLCHERGTSFIPVDLRWNKSQSQHNSEHVLRMCLDSIGRCAPFFVCLLGDRYGVHRATEKEVKDPATEEWLDRNFEVASACGYDWVLEGDNRFNSITELEIVQASFRRKYDYGYFYFRSNSQEKKKLQDVVETVQDSFLSQYIPESEYAARKLRELKQQIIDTELPVRHFATLEELGELIIKDWVSVIDVYYPSISPLIFPNTDSEAWREWSAHESFAMNKCQVFVRTPRIREIVEVLNLHAEVRQGIKRKSTMLVPTAALNTFMTSLPDSDKETLPPVLVLAGESGCGKSTVLSHWLKQFTCSHPQVVVVPHFVGCDSGSFDITNFMRRCTKELRLQYLESFAHDVKDIQDLCDFTRITEAFRAAISLGPCVIVLDGANHLGQALDVAAFKVKQIQWLPSFVPVSCRIIITTTKDDITHRELSKRKDTYCIDVPRLFDVKGKNDLFKEYVCSSYKFLDTAAISKITSANLAHLPLFYVALACELRILGAHKNSERLLDSYVHTSTLFDLWTLIFRRWTHEYGWLRPAVARSPVPTMKTQVSRDRMNSGWVADVLRLIAVSREGLSESEVLSSLKVMGYTNKYEVTKAHWEFFRLTAEHALIEMPSGLLTFSHQSARAAVEIALLGNLTSPSRERAISPFQETWERQKHQGHAVLASFFSKQPSCRRTLNELPWQLNMGGNIQELSSTVCEPGMFVMLVSVRDEDRGKIDFMSYWRILTQKGRKPEEILYQKTIKAKERLYNEISESSDQELDMTSPKKLEVSAIEELCGKDDNEHLTQLEVALIHFFAGNFLASDGHYNMAQNLLLSAYKMAYPVVLLDDIYLLGDIQESLGNLYLKVSEMSKAAFWFNGALKAAGDMTRGGSKTVDQAAMIGRILDQMSLCQLPNEVIVPPLYHVHGRSRASTRTRRVKTATTSEKEETEDTCERHIGTTLDEALRHLKLANDFPGQSNVYFHMGLLAAKQRRSSDAESLFSKSLDMRRGWYGSSHPLVAEIYDALASTGCSDTSESLNVATAEKLFRESLCMREELLGPSHLMVASTLFKLSKLLQAKGTKDATREAKLLLQRALDIRTSKQGVYHKETEVIRRALTLMETSEVAVKLGGKATRKDREPFPLNAARQISHQ